jgi:hypothetical protein
MSEILHPSQLSTTFIEVSEIDDQTSTAGSSLSSPGMASSIRHENSNDVRLQEHILKQLNPVSVQLSAGNCNLLVLDSEVYKVNVSVEPGTRIYPFAFQDPTADECRMVASLRSKITEDTLGMYGAASIYFEFDSTRSIKVNYDKIGSMIVINLDKYQPSKIKQWSSFREKNPCPSWLQRKYNWIDDNLSGGISIVGLSLMVAGVCMLAKSQR